MRELSRFAKGAWRQYRDRRLRYGGVLDVFHAERVFSGLSALAGEGPGPLQRADPVRHRQNSLRQLHPRCARRGGPWASAALFRTYGNAAGRARHAAGLRSAGRQNSGRTLVAFDGTQYFCSQKLRCPNCLTRERSNGQTENYHCLLSATVVAPGHSKVVPLIPEFVATQDGAEKQDCELSVNLRFIATTPSSAGSTVTTRVSRRCARSSWATISSLVIPSAR